MAMMTTPIPAYANDRRKYSGKITMAARATATVADEKTTVRPAVCRVRATAASVSPCRASSSRNLLTMSSE
jgi:hypothetical protein